MNLKRLVMGYKIILTETDSLGLAQNSVERRIFQNTFMYLFIYLFKYIYLNFTFILKSISRSTFWWKTGGQRRGRELGQKRDLSHQTRMDYTWKMKTSILMDCVVKRHRNIIGNLAEVGTITEYFWLCWKYSWNSMSLWCHRDRIFS